jgi:hypothetical protein
MRQLQVMDGYPRPGGGGVSANEEHKSSNGNSYSPGPEPATRIMDVMVIEPYCSSPVPTGKRGESNVAALHLMVRKPGTQEVESR